jgi:DNA-binding transcriptional LysR family regulator
MELRQLATFRAVAHHLSFTRAAVELDYAQSSVTAQIQALEEELGVPLFDRVGKKVTLTVAGQRLNWYTEKILNLAMEARTVVSGQDAPSGSLVISAPETACAYILPPVLASFQEKYPQVRLIFKPMGVSDLRRNVGESIIDMAFLIDEILPAPNLVIEQIAEVPVLICAPARHPLVSKNQRISPTELEGEPLLLTESGCTYRELFSRTLRALGVQPNVTLEFTSVESIKQCVISGMGITVLPGVSVQREVEAGQLAVLPWTAPDIKVYLQMVWHRDRWMSPALAAFLDLTREILGAPSFAPRRLAS